ncbi:D-alanyl-D-alanine carboxypeptidase family protein [Patescibacteria group bacterium]
MLTSFLQLYAAITIGTGDIAIDTPVEEPVENPVSYEETLPSSSIPLKKEHSIAPIIEAEAAIIVDFDSGTILYEKNPDTKLQIASITKLMTAIIALEEGDLDETVYVSSKAAQTEGSKVWLYGGEEITLRNLLLAILIHSGNDAAVAVAEHIGGDVPTFVQKMNDKTKKIGLYSTHYENPIGFDALENYSTVHDLALLARYAYRKPFIRRAVIIPSMSISSADGSLSHDLESTNDLLGGFMNVLGLKTGHTELAGLCFVSIIENDNDNKIITVVLNSPARFTETKRLASWAFRSYIW